MPLPYFICRLFACDDDDLYIYSYGPKNGESVPLGSSAPFKIGELRVRRNCFRVKPIVDNRMLVILYNRLDKVSDRCPRNYFRSSKASGRTFVVKLFQAHNKNTVIREPITGYLSVFDSEIGIVDAPSSCCILVL